MCAEPIADEHGHLVDLESRSLHVRLPAAATCCSPPEGAGGGRYRAVPDRYLAFADFAAVAGAVGRAADPGQRRVLLPQLDARAGSRRSTRARPGATESLLPLDTWDELVDGQPRRWRRCAPDVEALLVRADRDAAAAECFLVPIDACYELVGQLRRLWRGFDGGTRGARRARRVLRRVRPGEGDA